MIRVFVVDDSPFVRKVLRRVLTTAGGIEVVGEAATGAEAVTQIPVAEPHVVTLDIEMPGMNGLQVLRQLLAWRPELRVIMLSAHTREGAEATLEALALGAADFIDKQSLNLMDLEHLGRELGERIRLLGDPVKRPVTPPAPLAGAPTLELDGVELCVIGASTGGPAALQLLLEQLPAGFPLPIAIVQHMPPGFTRPFANRLNGLCRLAVKEAVDGERLEPGKVFIAPAGQHFRLSASLVVMLSTEPRTARHIPSVDLLFRSAARARPGRVLGILLTGMGEDGAEALGLIRAEGGVTIAESEESCAVYGMPRAAVERGAARYVLPLPAIAAALAGLKVGR
jgi:two-component system, chemotaxis family, protein-glutamate methylesterase/glutaminase